MKKEIVYILIGIALLFLVFNKKTKKIMSNLPRGLRNKNPGNIIKTYKTQNGKKVQTFWEGEIPGQDTRFKTFKDMGYGYRAIFVLLNSYLAKGRNTLEKIISVYAPSSENNTENYISILEKKTGIRRDEAITENNFPSIVRAISFVENGTAPDEIAVNAGFKLYKNV